MTTDEMFGVKTQGKGKPDLRNQDHPLNEEEKLETGLEDSMDASDPPSATAPGDHGDPVPSSGFDKDAEAATEAANRKD